MSLYNVESDYRKSIPGGQRLCSFCQRFNFRLMLAPLAGAKPEPAFCHLEKFIGWDASVVLRNRYSCTFCDLLYRAVTSGSGSTIDDGFILLHIDAFDAIDPRKSHDAVHTSRIRLWITASKRLHTTADNHDRKECSDIRRRFYLSLIVRPDDNTLAEPSLLEQFPGSILAHGSPFDPTTALSWLDQCERTHGSKCKPQLIDDDRQFQFRLIDTTKVYIVDKPPRDCKYLALSYVWGDKQKQHSLTTSNYSLLTVEATAIDEFKKVSLTVIDAISFCQKIGVKFLWVDALCIIQDSEADKQAQLPAMGMIYRCAHATIVAASGRNASTGIPGIYPHSREPPMSSVGQVDGMKLMVSTRHLAVSILDSPWETRAWTFQEKIFSKRMIVFMSDQVHFKCNRALWREDCIFESDSHCLSLSKESHMERILEALQKERGDGNIDSQLSLLAFTTYNQVVQEYTLRKLTFEKDILNALSGIQTVLSPLLNGFLWGIPNSCFEAALTWRSKDPFPLPKRTGFPSWSWAGWKGTEHPIRYSNDDSQNSDISFAWGYGAEVTWYYITDPEGSVKTISNEKPHHYSPAMLTTQLRSQTRSKYHVESIKLPPKLEAPFSQYLVFWTSSVMLRVSYECRRHREVFSGFLYQYEEFAVQEPEKLRFPFSPSSSPDTLSTIRLDPTWRRGQPLEMEFIVITTDENCNLLAMMIEWRNGVAYRIQMASSPISPLKWYRANSQRKMIILR